MATSLKSLVAKLNGTCRAAMEGAAGLCLARTHYDVEIEHLLMKLAEADNSDFRRILRHYDVNASHLERDLTKALDSFKTGNTRTPALSVHLPRLLERAWVEASVEYGLGKVRSGQVVLALLGDPELARLVKESSREWERISAEDLRRHLPQIVEGSVEDRDSPALAAAGVPAAMGAEAAPRPMGGKTPALDQFTINLTQRAKEGKIDPVLGRDAEIRQMVDILTRRRQNNPILTGEAGVGKTAVVEGLALRIVRGDVPPALQGVVLHTLDLGLLQAGASVKGEFENRVRGVIEEVKRSPHPIVVFIDEAHQLIGAGGQAGQSDAANLLKPALARGEMRTIAATTWSEYKKYFEKDAALARRFQVVKIDEPDEAKAVDMLRGVTAVMEAHHKVRILDEAVVEAVKLSHRYLAGRQLPDKAVSVLDTSCARIGIGQSSTPAPVEDAKRRIENIKTEIGALEREIASGAEHAARVAALKDEQSGIEKTLAELEARWRREKELVAKILEVEKKLEAPGATADDTKTLRAELNQLRTDLKKLQGEEPLVQPCVDGDTVGQVISAWTGIPVGKMLSDEVRTVLNLKDQLEERVIGQSHALEAIAQRIRTARAQLEDPSKPKGVFLLVGTSGVGKTETALALADVLYGGERNMVTINMSEYQEAHTVSSLKGSPPGYVGYGEGGVLTEAVRRRPYCVVLLDEIEKSHPDVHELFFQVFDKGVMEDGEGREIDFKNTIILLTSNVGTDTIMRACSRKEGMPSAEELLGMLRPDLQEVFKPAFLGRLVVVPFYPLRDENMRKIVRLKLNKIKKRIRENHGAEFVYDDALVDAISARCTEVDAGARNIDYILTGTLLPEISGTVLAKMAEGQGFSTVRVGVGEGKEFTYAIS